LEPESAPPNEISGLTRLCRCLAIHSQPACQYAAPRGLPWQERRVRLGLLARAFDVPLELSPLVDPSVSLVEQMTDGRLEGIVLKDRTSTYRDGTRVGWSKIKDRSWYEREAWRFDRRLIDAT
jgi:hypothetical protein